MNNICLIDTSVFLNILDVPSKNSDREEVFESFETYTKLGCEFIIPVATIIETGNHDALMAANGFYADLYNSQFSGNVAI